jgi:hypothetical protein
LSGFEAFLQKIQKNKETRKEKKKTKEKYEKGPGGTVSAQARIQPIAQLT